LEGLLELKDQYGFQAKEVDKVDIEIFDVAYNIIGGGEEGDKKRVQTKEEADHSLPYLTAVALLDGPVMPEQYRPDRIQRQDVQVLLQKVFVRPKAEYSARFPGEMPCRLGVTLRDGRVLTKEKKDYEGFHTRPMPWDRVLQKFDRLSARCADPSLRREIASRVGELEKIQVADLTSALAHVRVPPV
jgi:2-methylcitrate dehydratase